MDAYKYIPPDISMLYDTYADMLYRISYSLLMSKEDAKDSVADVFEKYIRKKPLFNDSEHEKAWFIRTITNHCHDMARHQKKYTFVGMEILESMPDNKESDGRDIYSVVLTLPEKYKIVLLLYYFEDIDIKHIAMYLKISESAVKMRMKRGRQLMKEILEREEKM